MEKRMYFLTMYNLSPIQQGIQCGHAALRYTAEYKEENEIWDFIENHETWIILNGGTSNSGGFGRDKSKFFEKGSMEKHLEILLENEIKCVPFYEPDLNNSLTSICFIVDERVFNKEKYPDFDYQKLHCNYSDYIETIGEQNIFLRQFLQNFNLA
jgi:hypothetical protein